MTVSILIGDCREMLASLPAESVQCCVTSPPYFGLRDYGCEGQIGLEPTFEAYIAEMVAVFREVRRVLRPDGTLWLNLGDSYAGGGRGRGGTFAGQRRAWQDRSGAVGYVPPPPGLKAKDRMMIPARVAIALCNDGWWLRDEIIWHKPNAMPSSVSDRTTPSHEMIYLLTKSRRYFYDAKAIAEPAVSTHRSGNGFKRPENLARKNADGTARGSDDQWDDIGGHRNSRSVWSITTKPYKGPHFATMAPDLAEKCILAGSRTGDVVLDPFGGSGTTGMVAARLGRNSLLIELNPEYEPLITARLGVLSPLTAWSLAA